MASLFVRPDGQLVVVCPFLTQVRLVDPRANRQVATIAGLGGSLAVATPDGRRLLVVERDGSLQEIDLVARTFLRRVRLTTDGKLCATCVPYQQLHLSADGMRLFVRAAPERPELTTSGSGSVVWVVATDTLRRVAEVRLPAAAFDSAPLPDGRALLTSNTNTQDADQRATRLVEVPSGRELARWRGATVAFQTDAASGVSGVATPQAEAVATLGRIAFVPDGDI